LGMHNDSLLPIPTAYARDSRTAEPAVVRLSVPLERIVSGRRIDRTWGLPGGGRTVMSWTVLGQPDEVATITVIHPVLGERTIAVPLRATAPTG
ncbi:MAG: hypothetical protein KDA22_03620, partial [Phycisphaerales bacterium]|nr:hypothetical protein [Phycisphaerales bacterium]